MSLISSIPGVFLCLSFLLVWLSWLLQPQLLACCSSAQTRCPDLITAKNRDPTYISSSDQSQVSLYLSFSPLTVCGDICDNSMCLSAISCLELFCFLIVQKNSSPSLEHPNIFFYTNISLPVHPPLTPFCRSNYFLTAAMFHTASSKHSGFFFCL